MVKRYARVNYQNKPSTATPVNATNLNKMDKGIDDIDNAVEDLYNVKFDKSNIVQSQVNDTTKVPSAALAYAMGQQLTQLNNNLVEKTAITYTPGSGAISYSGGTIFKRMDTTHFDIAFKLTANMPASLRHTYLVGLSVTPTISKSFLVPVTSVQGIYLTTIVIEVRPDGEVIFIPTATYDFSATNGYISMRFNYVN